MKKLFNGDCKNCGEFKPRCAEVHFRRPHKATEYEATPTVLCPDCRRANHGKFRAAEKHK